MIMFASTSLSKMIIVDHYFSHTLREVGSIPSRRVSRSSVLLCDVDGVMGDVDGVAPYEFLRSLPPNSDISRQIPIFPAKIAVLSWRERWEAKACARAKPEHDEFGISSIFWHARLTMVDGTIAHHIDVGNIIQLPI